MTSAEVYDLTNSISPYLDLHMMFPLLEYVDSLISTNAIPYSAQDVAKARLSLLRPTHMVDYAMDIYRELHGKDCEIPAEMEQQKKDVLQKLEDLKSDKGCQAFEDLCNNTELRVSNLVTSETCMILKIVAKMFEVTRINIKNAFPFSHHTFFAFRTNC